MQTKIYHTLWWYCFHLPASLSWTWPKCLDIPSEATKAFSSRSDEWIATNVTNCSLICLSSMLQLVSLTLVKFGWDRICLLWALCSVTTLGCLSLDFQSPMALEETSWTTKVHMNADAGGGSIPTELWLHRARIVKIFCLFANHPNRDDWQRNKKSSQCL